MKAAFVVAPAAEQDIVEIGAYVETHDRHAALELVTEIYDCFSRLAERPAMGHRRPDLTILPVRFWTLRGRYMVAYRGEAAPIEIVRVLSAYRDITSLLAEEPS